jgi:hypothetical protein
MQEAPHRACRRGDRSAPNDYTLMTQWNTEELIAADKRFVWHLFTDMREWCAAEHEPLVLVEGRSALLRDSKAGNISMEIRRFGQTFMDIIMKA